MRAPARCRQRGVTRIEFVSALALLAVFGGCLLERLADYEELAEKTMVDLTIGSIRDGIRHELIRSLLDGQDVAPMQWLERNPLHWSLRPPGSYMGEVAKWPQALQPGAWYFIKDGGMLVYVPRRHRHLSVVSDTPTRLSWHLVPSGSKGFARLEAVRIEAHPPFSWF